MPWYGHAPDAPDTHRRWADPGSKLEEWLHASGWCHEVPAPGADEPAQNLPGEQDADETEQVVAVPLPPAEVTRKVRVRRAPVDRES